MKKSDYHKRMNKIIGDKLYPMFRQASINLLMSALNDKAHGDLTGNTLTSFTAGIYKDGTLQDVVNIVDVASIDSPEYTKLSNDMGVVSINRYDNGELVNVDTSKLIDTDNRYGFDTAKSFLSGYRPRFSKGWSLVITTGTEYSEFLEEVRHLNVLTETFLWSDNILKGVFAR